MRVRNVTEPVAPPPRAPTTVNVLLLRLIVKLKIFRFLNVMISLKSVSLISWYITKKSRLRRCTNPKNPPKSSYNNLKSLCHMNKYYNFTHLLARVQLKASLPQQTRGALGHGNDHQGCHGNSPASAPRGPVSQWSLGLVSMPITLKPHTAVTILKR